MGMCSLPFSESQEGEHYNDGRSKAIAVGNEVKEATHGQGEESGFEIGCGEKSLELLKQENEVPTLCFLETTWLLFGS